MSNLKAMIVFTAKRDGETQNVHGQGFYSIDELSKAIADGERFLRESVNSKRSIVRIELYNPQGEEPE